MPGGTLRLAWLSIPGGTLRLAWLSIPDGTLRLAWLSIPGGNVLDWEGEALRFAGQILTQHLNLTVKPFTTNTNIHVMLRVGNTFGVQTMENSYWRKKIPCDNRISKIICCFLHQGCVTLRCNDCCGLVSLAGSICVSVRLQYVSGCSTCQAAVRVRLQSVSGPRLTDG